MKAGFIGLGNLGFAMAKRLLSQGVELVVWSRDMVQTPLRFRSDLNFAIDAAFRRHGIQVPFPQRDLHLKSGRVPGSLPTPEPDAPKTEGQA